MNRIYMIREWLRRELEAQERPQDPFTAETEYEALLRELLAVIDNIKKQTLPRKRSGVWPFQGILGNVREIPEKGVIFDP